MRFLRIMGEIDDRTAERSRAVDKPGFADHVGVRESILLHDCLRFRDSGPPKAE